MTYSKDYPLVFPLLKQEKFAWVSRWLFYVLLLSFVINALSFFIEEKKYYSVTGVVFISFLLFFFVIQILFKRFSAVGKVTMEADKLIIDADGQISMFWLKDIKELKIKSNDYAGKTNFLYVFMNFWVAIAGTKEGTDNFIEFEAENRFFRYRFFLENINHYNLLTRRISEWKKEGF